jgi:ubiquinone/menaquinone biosynthesis C-methylase UbiE
MEGRVARWYARQRGTESQLASFRELAARLTADLPEGARVLEVAPGPGYLSVEIARRGRFRVTGLDISRTFVAMATENARRAGVDVELRLGDAANLPFEAGTFDLVVCQAAFKNFAAPRRALEEMHRVLRPGGRAVIQDLRKDASRADIAEEVSAMKLGRWSAFATRLTLGTMLRRRAYTPSDFEHLVAETAFRACTIRKDGIGMEVRLTRSGIEKAA